MELQKERNSSSWETGEADSDRGPGTLRFNVEVPVGNENWIGDGI